MDILVRIGGLPDAATLSELLYEFNGEVLPPDQFARRMEQVKGLETVFLGDVEGMPAGLLILRTAPTLSMAEDWAEITEMYVRPPFRRRGVGRALVERAVGHARYRGCTEVHLLTDATNVAAQSFYQAVGFRQDSWEMRLEIQRLK
jgi:ribosomal protein S18 acetylase RimI-like enzyme